MYAVDSSLDLEKAYRVRGATNVVAVEACHRAYLINVATMEQINEDTGVIRSVQRLKSGMT